MNRKHYHHKQKKHGQRRQPMSMSMDRLNSTDHNEMAEVHQSSLSACCDHSLPGTESENDFHKTVRTPINVAKSAGCRINEQGDLPTQLHSKNLKWEESESVAENINLHSHLSHTCQQAPDFNLIDHKVNNQSQNISSNILKLPDDVIYIIVRFLNPSDLCKLSLVCTRFYHICSQDCVWLQLLRKTIFHSGLPSSPFRGSVANKELYRLALNWENGRFQYGFKAKHKTRLIPWLQKEDNVVWFSSGNAIRNFQYDRRRHTWRENRKKSLRSMVEDVTRFSVKHNMLAAGCRDGRVYLWTTASESLGAIWQNESKSEILCVDLTDQAIVSGSKDGICTVTHFNHPHDPSHKMDFRLRSFNAGEKVWSLKISPCERFFVAGLSGYLDSSPLAMWDIESGHSLGSLGLHHRHGAGVLDIKFISQHEMLTCGYDAILRLWDIRTQKCVNYWVEPYDYTLYSLATNGYNGIAVGTARHGLVRLWDKRSSEHIQCYYSEWCSSPVYSLAMDRTSLFLAVDMGFSTMDFSIR